mmetsp:Transcript_9634/g.12594  ORF Transcript_9634/g.12594 Transcript_9634/m.12594 type:complete len:357 (-) Transcript_9634:141-1211(-)
MAPNENKPFASNHVQTNEDNRFEEVNEHTSRKRARTETYRTDECKESEDSERSLIEQYLSEDVRIYEYSSSCNPEVPQIPVVCHPPELHQAGPTRVIPFDLSRQLKLPYRATSPNLLASYIRICESDSLTTEAVATSQAFYVIRGSGRTESEFGSIHWNEGDLFVLPASEEGAIHHSTSDSALYWVSDEPLLKYLGVKPSEKKFSTVLFKKERMLSEVEVLQGDEDAVHRNRLGILLGNKATEETTKTLTHVLWALLNVIPGKTDQKPHKHNSVALDFCVSAPEEGVYTLMGPELDEDGKVKNPIRMDWKSGAAFTTPPGWWHSHHNETDSEAWVLPVQDAGVLTHQSVLDIQFAP